MLTQARSLNPLFRRKIVQKTGHMRRQVHRRLSPSSGGCKIDNGQTEKGDDQHADIG